MASYQKYLEAEALAPTVTQRISAVDTDDWFRIGYDPKKGVGGITAATIALIQASSMTFLTDGAVPTGVDAIGTAGVIDTGAAAYNTLGELQDYITSLGGGWWMDVRAGLRSDLLAKALAKSATSCFSGRGLSFANATLTAGGATEYMSICITGQHFVNGEHWTDWGEQCINQLMSMNVRINMASAGSILIYEGRQGVAETLLHTIALADDTAVSKNEDASQQVYCEAHPGHRLIIRASHATDIAAAPTEFVVRGRTIVPNGEHVISYERYAV